MNHVNQKSFPLLLALLFSLLVGCASSDTGSKAGQYIDDTVITTKVKAAIFKDKSLNSTEINVETLDGVVQLSGFVSSQAEIDRATEVARTVKGVRSVRNDIALK